MRRSNIIPWLSCVLALALLLAAQPWPARVATASVSTDGGVDSPSRFDEPKSSSQAARFGLELIGQIGGPVIASAVVGNYAYAINDAGLRVIDVTDPAAPVEIGFCGYPGAGSARAVAAAGHYVYVVHYSYVDDDESSGLLQVIDVANPAAPVEIGRYRTAKWIEIWDIAVSGGYTYIADDVGLRVIDVTNPQSPTEAGHLKLEWTGDDQFSRDVAVAGSYAYVVEAASHWRTGLHGGKWVISIANPVVPTQVWFQHWVRTAMTDVSIADSYAYIAHTSGIQVIDVADQAAPVMLGHYGVPWASAVAVAGRYAYMAGWTGLSVIDVDDPVAPVEVAFYAATGATHVAVAGSYIYVAAGDSGLLILRFEELPATRRIWLPVIARP